MYETFYGATANNRSYELDASSIFMDCKGTHFPHSLIRYWICLLNPLKPTASEWSAISCLTNVWLILEIWRYLIYGNARRHECPLTLRFHASVSFFVGHCTTKQIFTQSYPYGHNCKKHETIFASSIISDQWPSRGSWQPRHESLSWLKDHIPTKTLTYFRYLPNIWWHDSQYLGANSSTFKLDHHTWIRCVKVQIQLIIQNLPHFDPIRVINHYLFKVGFPNLEDKFIWPLFRSPIFFFDHWIKYTTIRVKT